jgi:putative ABC transport system substrate-binding protein
VNKRRKLVIALGAAALAAPFASFAQPQGKVWRVGFLNPAAADSRAMPRLQAFREGMREHGYVEGRNLQIEARWAEGKPDRMAAFAAELVAIKVDAIVTGSTATVDAARRATKSIPIVMAQSADPVADGQVASLARPGGNITGLSSMARELGEKRIELLKEVFPKLSRTLAVMWNPAQFGMRARFDEANAVAPKLGLGVRSVEVRNLDELASAFEALGKVPPEALVVIADPFTAGQRARIVEFAAAKRLPAIYETVEFAEAGGLMSYGADLLAQYRRAAYYVDRIFKGAKAGELPIEQPVKFDFVINMKTAKALDIKVPNSILVQATKVIE